jgi:hypothetical protein
MISVIDVPYRQCDLSSSLLAFPTISVQKMSATVDKNEAIVNEK